MKSLEKENINDNINDDIINETIEFDGIKIDETEEIKISDVVLNREEHVSEEMTQKMWFFIVACIPNALVSGYIFGIQSYGVILLSILCCLIFEGIFNLITHVKSDRKDISGIITGTIIAFLVPTNVPIYILISGCAFSIIVVKKIFGGYGCNLVNPAVAGVAFMWSLFPVEMGNVPFSLVLTSSKESLAMTPWELYFEGYTLQMPEYIEMAFGFVSGGLGSVCVITILIGGIFLIVKKVINIITPLVYILTVCGLSYALGIDPIFQALSGTIVLVGFFILSDPITTPDDTVGKGLYAFFCGVFTVLAMVSGIEIEGALVAVLIINLWAGVINLFGSKNIRLSKGLKFKSFKKEDNI